MNTVRASQLCFFPPAGPSFRASKKPPGRKKPTLRFCNSSDGSESDSSPVPPEGDKRKQDILARIAMLQAQKVRLTDFLDERSEYLTQFAEGANAEFDEIGASALKELDEASARILENLESRMQAFDEAAEINKREIEKSEKELEQFEEKIEKDRNEGLFFKSLKSKKDPEKPAEAKAEAQKLVEITRETAGSNTRKNVYLALMALLGIAIANSLISPSEIEWKRVAAFVLIFLALLTQYTYEMKLSSKSDGKDEKD